MSTRALRLVLLALAVALLLSCNEEALVQRRIDIPQESKTLTLYGNFEIEHTNDSIPLIEIEGSQEAVEALSVKCVGDSIYIESASVNSLLMRSDTPLKVKIHFLPTDYLRIIGGGKYRFTSQNQFKRFELRPERYVGRIEADINAILFLLRADESFGEIILRGKAVGALLKPDGGQTMHAEQFHVRWLRVIVGTRSGIYVRPIEQLVATYWLVGATIHYYGNPKRIVISKDAYSGYLIRAGA